LRSYGFLALASACTFSNAAWAADCKPLNIVSILDMTPIDRGGRVTVPISLNGTEKNFLVDTGGVYPQVTAQVAEELKLPQHHSPVEFYSEDGSLSQTAALVHDFTRGKLRASDMNLQISPAGMEIMSPVAFPSYDFEMNFAARKLNILSSDHCEGKVIYWQSQALAAVPIKIHNFHVEVPVKLDGKDFTAIIDTGSSTSSIRQDVARSAFDLEPTSPGMTPAGHLGSDEQAVIYTYPFKTLTFEGITVTNPKIAVLPNVMGKNADQTHKINTLIGRNSDDVALSEVIVGMDVLAKLHLYFAFKEHKLYITEASAAPAP
jgi:predicted aspartyl protease